jgi:hypothetical protein
VSKRRNATIPKKRSKAKPPTRVQYGALPYRLDDDGSVEVLLVTSRETKRWIIPKGWPHFPPIKCCGKERKVAALFDTEDAASKAVDITNRMLGPVLS